MKTSEVLDRAADLIEERGWTQGFDGWGHNEGSRLCIEGAVGAAVGMPRAEMLLNRGPLRRCPAYKAVAEYLVVAEADSMWLWNDTDGRTASEVIEVLRACAVIEASREREAVPSEQVAPEPVRA